MFDCSTWQIECIIIIIVIINIIINYFQRLIIKNVFKQKLWLFACLANCVREVTSETKKLISN